jgi:crotonobetainyl-CoA:carnitine CoA-transferase CaiB-like acyl-CoA transferase
VTIAMSPYKKLVGVLGDESLLAYDNPKALFDLRDEIWEKLSKLTRKWTTSDLLRALLAVDIWCGEVKTHVQAADDVQVQHMNMITSYEHPVAGTVKVVAPATKLSETPATIDRPAPLVGEHTRAILAEFGYSDEQISDYLQRGVIAQA